MAELQSVKVQLESVAGKADARGQKLVEHADVIQQKAAECERAITSDIDSWRQFDEQCSDVDTALDDVQRHLPDCMDVTSDVAVLQQQLKDCQDASAKLQSVKPHVSDVTRLGQLILEHVDSPHIHSQLDNLTDRVGRLSEITRTDIQQYASYVLCI